MAAEYWTAAALNTSFCLHPASGPITATNSRLLSLLCKQFNNIDILTRSTESQIRNQNLQLTNSQLTGSAKLYDLVKGIRPIYWSFLPRDKCVLSKYDHEQFYSIQAISKFFFSTNLEEITFSIIDQGLYLEVNVR